MSWTSDQVRTFFDAHWTVRKYKPEKIPADHLDLILHAAQRAPTDATAQMYSLVHLVDPKLRARIAELSTNAHIATASDAFIVCADIRRLSRSLALGGHAMGNFPEIAVHFATGDAVMAGQNLLVAAEMLGYRGCWIGGVLSAIDEIADAVALPAGVLPFAGLTIGVPDEPPSHRPRLPRPQVVHTDRYADPSEPDLRQACADMCPITGRGDWIQTLARYFAKGGGMESRNPKLEKFINERFLAISPG